MCLWPSEVRFPICVLGDTLGRGCWWGQFWQGSRAGGPTLCCPREALRVQGRPGCVLPRSCVQTSPPRWVADQPFFCKWGGATSAVLGTAQAPGAWHLMGTW